MKALIIGGRFDRENGKPSSIVAKLATALGWEYLNGGHYDQLRSFNFKTIDTLLWMPDIDNAEDKILPRIKAQNQALTLISTKRIVEKSYTDFDVLGRLLKSHSNLGVAIRQENGVYSFKLTDPLGNQYCDTPHIPALAEALKKRVLEIKTMTRIGSESISSAPMPHAFDPRLIESLRRLGDEFSRHVNAINPERFLGNASARPTDRITRCCHGFPAMRADDVYLVSRRNVDKTTLGDGDFVAIRRDEDKVRFYGTVKPSVDSPIQIRLLNHFSKVNVIVHGHTYVHGAPMTHSKIPCGHIEEFQEIVDLIPEPSNTNFAVNLNGHGCLLFAEGIDYLRAVKFRPRPFPEV